MKKFMKSLFWIRIFVGYLIAFSILAFCVALPFGFTGFLSGYVGWAVLLFMFMLELDEETKDALKKWVLKNNKEADDHV